MKHRSKCILIEYLYQTIEHIQYALLLVPVCYPLNKTFEESHVYGVLELEAEAFRDIAIQM